MPERGSVPATGAQIPRQTSSPSAGSPAPRPPGTTTRLSGPLPAAPATPRPPSIAWRDRLQGDVVHARKSGRWAGKQSRQFPAVPLRQVSPGRANLFFDQVEVVEQPFPGRRNTGGRLDL